MNKLQHHIHDNKNGLDYVLTDHYYLPALRLPEDKRPIGRWGRLHKEYLKTYRPDHPSCLLLYQKYLPVWESVPQLVSCSLYSCCWQLLQVQYL